MRKIILLCSTILAGCSSLSQTEVVELYEAGHNDRALAIAKDGAVGASWRAQSIQEAMNEALRICRKSLGVGCKIVSVNGAKHTVSYNPQTDKLVSLSNKSKLLNKYICADLSQSLAYQLLYQGHSYLDRDSDGHPCEWGRTRRNQVFSKPAVRSSNCHWVKGHMRSGKWVSGYRRCR